MLTEAERKRVLFHLDYALLTVPTTLSLGLPIITQARFLVEQNMLAIDPQSEPAVREMIGRLDCIILEMDQARRALIISETGGTKFRENALQYLEIEHDRWRTRLGDMLGAQQNPVSQAAIGNFGGVVEGC